MNKGFGVQVTVSSGEDAPAQVQPLVVVARDERDAELVAVAAAGGSASAETVRQLSDEEVANYGLDLARHGDAKALPVLNL